MSATTAKKSAVPQKASPAMTRNVGSEVSRTPANKKKSYASEGATDNDVFLLPLGDYYIMGLLTLLAGVVRLFRIYQPSSVVFDEVQ